MFDPCRPPRMRPNYALERSVTALSERAAGARKDFRACGTPAALCAARSTRTLDVRRSCHLSRSSNRCNTVFGSNGASFTTVFLPLL